VIEDESTLPNQAQVSQKTLRPKILEKKREDQTNEKR
jgi:hypothetical protein